jgi:uncharacterized membrane protein YwzB
MRKIKNAQATNNKNVREDLKKAFQIVLSLICLFIIFYALKSVIGYFDKIKEIEVKRNAVLADGVIIKIGSMKGSYAIAKYSVYPNNYEIKAGSPADDISVGQKFKIAYDAKKPESATIMFEMPFFCPLDKTDTTFATIIDDDKHTVRFKYNVNGVEYKKFQKKTSGTTFKIDSIFTVEYLINKPIIAIIKDTITGSCL